MVKFIGITTAGKFQNFQGPLLLFKDFPGLEFYFFKFKDLPGFSRTVGTLRVTGAYKVHAPRYPS